VVELDPMSDRAWFGIAQARATQGDLAGAVADLDRAISLNPAAPEYYDVRGELRTVLGDPAGAAADAERAAKLRDLRRR